MKEERCIILDFLPNGYPDRRHAEPIAQAIGCNFFSLLEIVPRENITLKPLEEVYIGDGKRDKVRFIKSQLEYKYMTNHAQSTLEDVVENLVKANEKPFVDFFNKGHMITPRMHQFQLLPGIGKKHLLDILEERKKKPFESFADITTRVKQFTDPAKTVVKRIMEELTKDEKYHLFTPQPKKNVY